MKKKNSIPTIKNKEMFYEVRVVPIFSFIRSVL
jgi:ribosomal protein S30